MADEEPLSVDIVLKNGKELTMTKRPYGKAPIKWTSVVGWAANITRGEIFEAYKLADEKAAE